MERTSREKISIFKSRRFWIITGGAVLLVAVVIFLCGARNPETQAGYEGYLRRGAIFGSTYYYGSQVGPVSPGMGWLLDVENVDFRIATFGEEFEVMSSDNLNLTFNAHLVIKPKDGEIRKIVEKYGGNQWYKRIVEQPFRNAVYEAVAGYRALDAKDKREEIAEKVTRKFATWLKNKPFELQSVVVGTINLPKSVAMAQEQKIAKETELERKSFEIDIAKKEAVVRVEEAKGIAESQHIINATLTPNYLQHEAIKAQEKMAMSPNHTTIYIPSGTNGIPLVRTVQ
jgi:hypothetical protein